MGRENPVYRKITGLFTIQCAPSTRWANESSWAALLARMYEVFPLICPSFQTPLTFIAFAFGELRFAPVRTEPEPIPETISTRVGAPKP